MLFRWRKSSARQIRRNAFFVPLLPYLMSGILAFAACARFENLRFAGGMFLLLGAFLFICGLTLNFLACPDGIEPAEVPGKTFRRLTFCGWAQKNLLCVCGVFFICAWYFFLRVPPNPYPDFTPREIKVSAVLDDVSHGAKNSVYGTATIVVAPEGLENLKGCKIWYSIWQNSGALPERLVASQTVSLDGVMKDARTGPLKSRGRGYGKSASFERYLASRFIYFKMSCDASGVEIIKPANYREIFYDWLNGYMRRSLAADIFGVDKESSDTYAAMLLGDKSKLTKEQKQSFSDTGTMHVFAISGLHIGFAAALIYALLRSANVYWKFQPLVALPVLYMYVCACGGRPSAMRAFAMIAVFWIAMVSGRGIKSFGALAIAAAAALAINPADLFDAGFVLSYAIVASIFLYGIPLYQFFKAGYNRRFFSFEPTRFQIFCKRAFSFAAGGFCISLGAAFAAAPLSAHYFSYVSTMSWLYSPVFVFGAGIVVGLGFAGFLLPNFLAAFLNWVACSIVGWMSAFAVWGAKNYATAVKVSVPGMGAAALSLAAYLVLSGLMDNRNPLLRFVLPPSLSLAILSAASIFQNG